MSAPADNRQETQYLSITISGASGSVQLARISGVERISDLYNYRLEMYVDAADFDTEALVGLPAAVKISVTDEDDRYIHGILTEVALTGVQPDIERVFFQAQLRPKLWALDLAADCKIFQNKSVTDIIDAILADGGVTDVKKSLTGTYTARDYCVQWRESPLNFIRRLMEDEGIFFFFEHSDSADTLVLGDDADAHVDCPVVAALEWTEHMDEPTMDNERVHDVRLEKRQITQAVGMRSYHFETPATSLTVSSEGDAATPKQNDWGWTHTTADAGTRLAGFRLGAHEAGQRLLRIAGTNRSLACGYKFELASHPISAVNGGWTILETAIDATAETFHVSALSFPATVTFRAPITAFRPFIPSTQTAKVVGPAGEEIHTDKYGRVKVKFHWDAVGKEDEKASCWIRCAQGWAGSGWGFVFLPRIGMEVVVSFLDGDPDQPLITGCVYNGTNSVPYGLPGEKTKSTIKTRAANTDGKFNEIRFEDKADAEEIYMFAQKDHNVTVENDETWTVKHDRTATITNDDTLTVDHDQTQTVKNNRTRTVTEGNETITISTGTREVTVEGGETHTNNANFTQNVKGDHTLSVGGNLTIEVKGSLSISAKDVKITASSAGSGITLDSGAAMALKSMQAMTLEATATLGMKGTAGAKLESPAKIDIETAGMLNAKGSMANFKADGLGEVSAGGILTVKGALVKIN
ncbi:type VI secretion system Vgr family protein [Lacibacterium aquatile]|uniref:Type VI secretion system Vgr family protein n=1 Tax=Lacibacterium aquatile TaxID=1168082 RepID=A0ABW5DSY4_9PROT